MITDKQMIQIGFVLSSAFPQVQASAETWRVWRELLNDAGIDFETAYAAAKQMAVSSEFLTLNRLMEICRTIRGQVAALPTAADAWGEVTSAIRNGGYSRYADPRLQPEMCSPKWTHELVARTVGYMGGFWQLCDVLLDDIPTVRAQFMRMYDQLVQRHEQDARLLPSVKEAMAGQLPPPAAPEPKALPAPERNGRTYTIAELTEIGKRKMEGKGAA